MQQTKFNSNPHVKNNYAFHVLEKIFNDPNFLQYDI
jgi:uncharacterized protein (UPF0147 family)